MLGVIQLSDVVKPGMRERFAEMRAMGIRTVMITGDNPLTARAIAAEAGVDDHLAEATPEDKMALIRKEQEGGRLVAMTGDGTNDAPALAQADVGVAMNTGTAAAKEAGNMVDLDSDPTKLIDIVEIGKQLLITRGALTTFSIANDLAKYFAILPAMFAIALPVARRAERHAAGHAGVGDPLRGHLQRADHRRADPAGPARCALPAHHRGAAAAPQPADLRRGRRGHPVRRHLPDRPARPPHPGNLIDADRILLRQTGAALRMLLVATVVLGLAYPLAVWGVARLPGLASPAEGSIVHSADGTPVGSTLIGIDPVPADPADDPYFHARPSASAEDVLGPGDPSTSGGSNKGGFDEELLAQRRAAPGRDRRARGRASRPVPADAVTASASGVDPHICPAYAELQVPRVARVTGLSEERVGSSSPASTQHAVLGILGADGVNVTRAEPGDRRAGTSGR